LGEHPFGGVELLVLVHVVYHVAVARKDGTAALVPGLLGQQRPVGYREALAQHLKAPV
jgi:hypothetical protein